MVARLTPDQKAACSNHVGVNLFSSLEYQLLNRKDPLKLSSHHKFRVKDPNFGLILQVALSDPAYKYSRVRGGKFLPIDADKCPSPPPNPLFPNPT